MSIQKDYNTYLYGALPLCAVLAHEHLHSWYHERYVHIYSSLHRSGAHTAYIDFVDTFAYNDVAHCESLDLRATEDIDDIIEFVKCRIDDGCYLTVFVDDAFLRGLSTSFVHEFMVYGYDDNSRQLAVLGFDDSWTSFRSLKFPYDDFSYAFDLARQAVTRADHQHMTSLVQTLRPSPLPTTFRLDRLRQQIAAYALSEPVDLDTRRERWWWMNVAPDPAVLHRFGISAYGSILCYLDSVLSGSIQDRETVDYRIFHLLVEQKRAVLRRLKLVAESYTPAEDVVRDIESHQRVFRDLNLLRVAVRKHTGLSPVDAVLGAGLESVLRDGMETINRVRTTETAIAHRTIESLERLGRD